MFSLTAGIVAVIFLQIYLYEWRDEFPRWLHLIEVPRFPPICHKWWSQFSYKCFFF